MSNYLYNGVKLPALPAWNNDALPFTCIQLVESGSYRFYSLIATNAAGYMTTDDSGEPLLKIEGDPIIYSGWNVAADAESAAGLSAIMPGLSTTGWLQYADDAEDTDGLMGVSDLVWTNTPLSYEDGTVYMEASEPKLYAIRIEQTAGRYFYNGVRLPALPAWDQDVYPYAILYYVEDADGNVVAHFGYSDRPYYLSTLLGVVTNPEGAKIYASAYDAEGKAWGEVYQFTDAAFALEPDKVIWANVDVHDDTGVLFLEASEPVPVPKFDIQELVSWLLAGLCSRPLPMGAREPVAYLYNGVRLPGLPEFDEQYAVIVKRSTGGYRLIATGIKPTLSWTEGAVRPKLNCSSVSYNWYIDEDGQEWETGAFHTYPTLSIAIIAVWANYDMLNEDGTLYFAASEPVPVYE